MDGVVSRDTVLGGQRPYASTPTLGCSSYSSPRPRRPGSEVCRAQAPTHTTPKGNYMCFGMDSMGFHIPWGTSESSLVDSAITPTPLGHNQV